MTELKPNHIQIDVSEFDPVKLEYVASKDYYPPVVEYALAKAVGLAYLEQKDSLIPAEPTGLGAVVSVKYPVLANRLIYVKAASESRYSYNSDAAWVASGSSERRSWSYIIDGAEEVKILSAGVEV